MTEPSVTKKKKTRGLYQWTTPENDKKEKKVGIRAETQEAT